MKVLAIILTVLVALVAVIVVSGYMLPRSHVASREKTLTAPPAAVYDVIVRTADYPQWRNGVLRVDELAPVEEKRSYREVSGSDAITYVVDEEVPGKRVVTRIADPSLPFGGSWTFEIDSLPEGSRLRITENGEVYNPIFRFASRFVLGHHATIDQYLADLETRLATTARGSTP